MHFCQMIGRGFKLSQMPCTRQSVQTDSQPGSPLSGIVPTSDVVHTAALSTVQRGDGLDMATCQRAPLPGSTLTATLRLLQCVIWQSASWHRTRPIAYIRSEGTLVRHSSLEEAERTLGASTTKEKREWQQRLTVDVGRRQVIDNARPGLEQLIGAATTEAESSSAGRHRNVVRSALDPHQCRVIDIGESTERRQGRSNLSRQPERHRRIWTLIGCIVGIQRLSIVRRE